MLLRFPARAALACLALAIGDTRAIAAVLVPIDLVLGQPVSSFRRSVGRSARRALFARARRDAALGASVIAPDITIATASQNGTVRQVRLSVGSGCGLPSFVAQAT